MTLTDADRARFWSKVEKTDGCWLWRGVVLRGSGYGALWCGGKRGNNRLAHRVSYLLAHGSLPKDLYVLHSCDVRVCVRPDHLRLGSHADNMADMKHRRRQAVGDRHGSRLHPERLRRGPSHPNFGRRFGRHRIQQVEAQTEDPS